MNWQMEKRWKKFYGIPEKSRYKFMKTVLSAADRSELISRIKTLNENNKPQWGKMNVHQMLKHCILCEELYLGDLKVKRSFIGRIVGQLAIKNILKNDSPLQKNAPTNMVFKINDTDGDVESEKQKWIHLIEKYSDYSKPEFTHWFFGKMSKEQVGQFAYKHADHHLRQFNS